VLFTEVHNLRPRVVVRCLRETFDHRATHDLPLHLQPPPESWRDGYRALAAECSLQALTLDQAFEAVSAYWGQLPLFPRSQQRGAGRSTSATSAPRAPPAGSAP
jgi:hypothetical protein